MAYTNLQDALKELNLSEAELKEKVAAVGIQVFKAKQDDGSESICFNEEDLLKLKDPSADEDLDLVLDDEVALELDEESSEKAPEESKTTENDLDFDVADDDLDLDLDDDTDLDLSDDELDIDLSDDSTADEPDLDATLDMSSADDDLDLDLDDEKSSDDLDVDLDDLEVGDEEDLDATLTLDESKSLNADETLSISDDDEFGDETLSIDEDSDSEDTLSFDLSEDDISLPEESFSLEEDDALSISDDDDDLGGEGEESEMEIAPQGPVTKIVDEPGIGFLWPMIGILCFAVIIFNGMVSFGLVQGQKSHESVVSKLSIYESIVDFVNKNIPLSK